MFRKLSDWCSNWLGHPLAFTTAVVLCILWAVAGPVFNYSDSWQLVINTATTVITFLMLFLVQSSQNRDTATLHAKLDLLMSEISEVDETKVQGESDG